MPKYKKNNPQRTKDYIFFCSRVSELLSILGAKIKESTKILQYLRLHRKVKYQISIKRDSLQIQNKISLNLNRNYIKTQKLPINRLKHQIN